MGGHAATVITALTVQSTVNVAALLPQRADDFFEQARAVIDDMPIAAVKIGLLGCDRLAEAVAGLLDRLPGRPVVVDPILAAGGGRDLAGQALIEVIRRELLPRATVLTPNTQEARRLTGLADAREAALQLLGQGCGHVLLTGGHEAGDEVVNHWFGESGVVDYRWPRLPGDYHGSGCTLAASLAACLARGWPIAEAIRRAQKFTQASLARGYRVGQGQAIPGRNG